VCRQSAFGNSTISILFVPIVTSLPPSVSTKNFLAASTFEVLRW
jgi:hypothetical protein